MEKISPEVNSSISGRRRSIYGAGDSAQCTGAQLATVDRFKVEYGQVWRSMVPQLPQPTTIQTHPVSSAKVDGLSKVVALVEATMVSTREGNDEFSCTLVCADNLRKKGQSH